MWRIFQLNQHKEEVNRNCGPAHAWTNIHISTSRFVLSHLALNCNEAVLPMRTLFMGEYLREIKRMIERRSALYWERKHTFFTIVLQTANRESIIGKNLAYKWYVFHISTPPIRVSFVTSFAKCLSNITTQLLVAISTSHRALHLSPNITNEYSRKMLIRSIYLHELLLLANDRKSMFRKITSKNYTHVRALH